MDINALRQKVADLAAAGRVVLQRNDGRPSPEDMTEHRNIMAEARSLGEQIEALNEQRNLEVRNITPATPPAAPDAPPAPPQTRSGWCMSAARALVSAIGNKEVARTLTEEEREMSVAVGGKGGIFVPDAFVPDLQGYKPEEELIMPGATLVPGGDAAPDAVLDIPALDQSAGAFAGIAVTWIDEGDPKDETDMDFDFVRFHPHEVAAHVVVTDKLLRNAPIVAKYLEEWMPKALRANRDRQFIGGNGVGVPLGINDVGNPALISVARAGGGAIAWADILGMLLRLAPESAGNAIWACSQSGMAQIATLRDANNQPIFIPGDVSKGIPATLYGIPIRFTGKVPVLGAAGDIMLIDRSFYGVRIGAQVTIDWSKHVHFVRNKTVIKIFHTVDGQPLVTSPLLLEDGATTVSPFVRLAA